MNSNNRIALGALLSGLGSGFVLIGVGGWVVDNSLVWGLVGLGVLLWSAGVYLDKS